MATEPLSVNFDALTEIDLSKVTLDFDKLEEVDLSNIQLDFDFGGSEEEESEVSEDIESHEIVEYLYHIFFISFTNIEVVFAHNSSKLLAKIFFIAHFLKTSFTKPSSSGTISLNKSLP